MATILATIFLPGFIVGVVSCWHSNNNNSNLLKTIVAHPSVVLMPAFTFYTFTSSTKWCKENTSKETQAQDDKKETAINKENPFITFSPKFTLLNIALSIGFNIVYGICMTQIGPQYIVYYYSFLFVPILGLLFTLLSLPIISKTSRFRSIAKYTLANLCLNLLAFPIFFILFSVIPKIFATRNPSLSYYLPVPILGLILTFLHVILIRCCKCSLTSSCCSCFSLPKAEYGALVCSDLNKPYILDANSNPKPVLEYEEVVQSTELVDTEEVETGEAELVELVAVQVEGDTENHVATIQKV